MEIKQAMQKALEFEEKGRGIYKEAAEKTGNPIVEKTFNYLADQEKEHIAEIKDYLENNNIGFKGEKPEHTKEFFTMTTKEFKEKTELSDDDIKAHETALELEKESYNFYKEQHDQAKDEELKRFFKFLMGQENAHYELVDKAYQFIKNPEAFYTEEEKWMADGG